jgi:hypothetical protein
MEFRSLHDDAKVALEAAPENAIISVSSNECVEGAIRARKAALTRKQKDRPKAVPLLLR